MYLASLSGADLEEAVDSLRIRLENTFYLKDSIASCTPAKLAATDCDAFFGVLFAPLEGVS